MSNQIYREWQLRKQDIISTLSQRNNDFESDDSGGKEMKKALLLFLPVIMLFLTAACAPGTSIEVTTSNSTIQLRMPGPNPLVNQPDEQGRVARAVSGLWHGFIAPVTLVLSFFDAGIQMYEVHNAGPEYNFGFFLGEALVFGLLGLFLRIRGSAGRNP